MDLVGEVREKSLEDVIEKAKDWALLNGFTMRPSGDVPDEVEFVPFTLLPSRFPRREYDEAVAVQPLINELLVRVSLDADFLRSALEPAASSDPFTRRLLQLHDDTVLSSSQTQRLSLGLLRADYMLDDGSAVGSRLKQVEVNTIASGQGWLGTACASLHRYVLAELAVETARLPENRPLDGLCSAMLEAWRLYGNPSAAVLFVVEEATRHISDQRYHEYRLRALDPAIRVLRLSLGQLAKRARLDSSQLLRVDEREIALVYLRSGYAPEQYPSEAEWNARLIIERSAAIKCPTIGLQLAGCKKVQQLLAQPNCLERFLGSRRENDVLRRHFAGLYSLDPDETGDVALRQALESPDDFVLKPQREGGSNNYFGNELRNKLLSLEGSDERKAWILMDRIRPASQKNYIVRPGDSMIQALQVNSELGIFGVVLADGDKILANAAVGHTLRTKQAEYDEGGVCSGRGACDSPLLI